MDSRGVIFFFKFFPYPLSNHKNRVLCHPLGGEGVSNYREKMRSWNSIHGIKCSEKQNSLWRHTPLSPPSEPPFLRHTKKMFPMSVAFRKASLEQAVLLDRPCFSHLFEGKVYGENRIFLCSETTGKAGDKSSWREQNCPEEREMRVAEARHTHGWAYGSTPN